MALPPEIRARLTLPAVAAPMFLCSGVELAAAACSAGIVGSLTRNHCRDIEEFEAQLQAVAAKVDGIVATIRAAEILGADLAYLGTRFIATREASAPDEYKRMILDGTAADVIYTDAVNSVPAMWLKASLRANGLDPEELPKPLKRGTDHLPEDVKPWKTVWSAGQGIGLIRDIPTVSELVRRLHAEYVTACSTADMAEAAITAMQPEVS